MVSDVAEARVDDRRAAAVFRLLNENAGLAVDAALDVAIPPRAAVRVTIVAVEAGTDARKVEQKVLARGAESVGIYLEKKLRRVRGGWLKQSRKKIENLNEGSRGALFWLRPSCSRPLLGLFRFRESRETPAECAMLSREETFDRIYGL